jgi:hypothetical protein
MAVEKFMDEELKAKLAEVLEEWPLYRRLTYTGADKVVTVPKGISLFCNSCSRDSFWETQIDPGTYNRQAEDNRRGFVQKEYKCKNCGAGSVRYYFYWGASTQNNFLFFKVGQYPELEERVSEGLVKALGPEDLKVYKNALRLRNFSFGIGAVAYMRRVVENQMNNMLEILYEAAISHNASQEVLARHKEVERDIRFSAKIDYAGELLPASFRPAGKPNPMAILHELASEGLHEKTDEDCIDIFDACRKTFDYVFGRIRIETEEAKKFVEGLGNLAGRRSKS